MRFKWPLMWRSTYDKAKAKGEKTFTELRAQIKSLNGLCRDMSIRISDLELELREAKKNDHRDGRGRFTIAPEKE
jgi:hypothetical protein